MSDCWHFWNEEGFEDYTLHQGEEAELHEAYAAMGPYFVEIIEDSEGDDQW
jgi:hypothetical protein